MICQKGCWDLKHSMIELPAARISKHGNAVFSTFSAVIRVNSILLVSDYLYMFQSYNFKKEH